MTQKLAIRVSLGADGKTPQWELMHEGIKVCDLTFIELVEHSVQTASSVRWIAERLRK